MTFFGPLRPAHTRIPITRNSARPGTVARILPILAASFALAVGAGPAKAAGPHAPAASDTLKVSLSAPPGGTVAEGATGHFEVLVEGSTADGAVTVRYSVSGTAVAGEDYTALSGKATVAKGENTARIALEALDDGILDKGETVVLALTGATGPGTLIVDGTAATAMIADEGTVTIALAAVSDTIGEGSAWRSAVTMSTPVANRVSIRWWTSDGTAVAGRDYVAADEVVSFQPGETTKPVEVRTLQDDNAEPVETFLVSVGPPGGVSGASGGINFAGAQSAFIECSVDFSPPDPRVFMLTLEEKNGKFIPVKAGTVIGTVSANTTDGIPYYELGGADKNKFSINSLTAEITAAAALAADLYDLEVTVHDECGAQASVDVSVLVKQPNQGPNANAGPDQTVYEGDRVDLDGTGSSDSDGTIKKWEWTDPVDLTDGDTSTPYFTAPTTGETKSYTFKLTVTDDDDATDSDEVKITVKPVPNEPPKANAGPDQTVYEGDRVDLDGTRSSDSDGTIKKWEWTDPVDLTDGDTSTPYFTAPTTGETKSYTFKLTVTDDDDATDSDDVTITVEPYVPPNEPPKANAGPDQTVDEGDRVDLDGSDSSDKDGTIEEYAWTQRSGPAVTLYNADKAGPHFWAPAVTSTTDLRFRLKVEDDDEATDTDDVTVTVEPVPPQECSITSVANRNFTVGEHDTAVGTVRVDANDCGTLDYALGGAGADDVSAAALSASSDDAAITGNFNFEARSSYDLTLTVSERGGSASNSGRVRISVTDENDAPRAVRTISRQRVQIGQPVSVNVTGYFTDEEGVC